MSCPAGGVSEFITARTGLTAFQAGKATCLSDAAKRTRDGGHGSRDYALYGCTTSKISEHRSATELAESAAEAKRELALCKTLENRARTPVQLF